MRTPEREVRGSKPTAAVLCPWARHFTPRKYWLITQEAMAPSRHDWKIVDWDVKPQHNQQPNLHEMHQCCIFCCAGNRWRRCRESKKWIFYIVSRFLHIILCSQSLFFQSYATHCTIHEKFCLSLSVSLSVRLFILSCSVCESKVLCIIPLIIDSWNSKDTWILY